MLLSKVIFWCGAKKRNPTLFHQYRELKRSEHWSREQLGELQNQKLRDLIRLAYDKTEYYHDLFDKNGLKPEDIQCAEDVKKLPILEKRDILQNTEAMRNRDCKYAFYSETSGSTGEPMVFYRSEQWDSAGRAAQMRGYSWYGVDPWEKNGYLWGHLYGSKYELKTRILDRLVNRFRMFSYDSDSIARFSKKLKGAAYLEGYSSMIYEVAKHVNESGEGPIHLKMVKGTSEKIFDSYQDEVRKAFGQKMISEYGAGESTLIAYECPCGNMHVVMENVIVEDYNGEILVTNLNSTSMPIIRYRLGDSVVIDREKTCPCGMKHEIITDVLGRVGKTVYGESGKYPSLTLYYIFKSFALKNGKTVNYQGVQRKKGELELHLDRDISALEKEEIHKECHNYFGEDIHVTLYPSDLVRDHTKKFQDFVSEIGQV